MADLSDDTSPVQEGEPVTITVGRLTLRGSVRAVGDVTTMPKQGEMAEANFRQVVVDVEGSSLPIEMWLADDEFAP